MITSQPTGSRRGARIRVVRGSTRGQAAWWCRCSIALAGPEQPARRSRGCLKIARSAGGLACLGGRRADLIRSARRGAPGGLACWGEPPGHLPGVRRSTAAAGFLRDDPDGNREDDATARPLKSPRPGHGGHSLRGHLLTRGAAHRRGHVRLTADIGVDGTLGRGWAGSKASDPGRLQAAQNSGKRADQLDAQTLSRAVSAMQPTLSNPGIRTSQTGHPGGVVGLEPATGDGEASTSSRATSARSLPVQGLLCGTACACSACPVGIRPAAPLGCPYWLAEPGFAGPSLVSQVSLTGMALALGWPLRSGGQFPGARPAGQSSLLPGSAGSAPRCGA